jgi:hypothetical protein
MWIPHENFYCRVEDTVVTTENGLENPARQCPLELHDVENLMKGPSHILSRGVLAAAEGSRFG